jgi:hypothetical protein
MFAELRKLGAGLAVARSWGPSILWKSAVRGVW